MVNNGCQLAPWADVLYACDYKWWQVNRGKMDFAGIKIGGDVRDVAARWGINPVRIDSRRDEILVYKFGTIGSGGNSGFQALNLAVQFGVRRVVLVGYDMHDRDGIHWHGAHVGQLHNPTKSSLERWRNVIDGQATALARLGVEVINASPSSALSAYPKMSFSAAMASVAR